MTTVILAALSSGHLYPSGNIIYVYRLSRPQGHSAAGRFKSLTQSGIEATFRIVAQWLNHLHHGTLPLFVLGKFCTNQSDCESYDIRYHKQAGYLQLYN